MQVNISVDTQDVEQELINSTSVEVEVLSGYVEGELTEIIEAVIKHLEFSFDRDDAEVGNVIQLPVSR